MPSERLQRIALILWASVGAVILGYVLLIIADIDSGDLGAGRVRCRSGVPPPACRQDLRETANPACGRHTFRLPHPSRTDPRHGRLGPSNCARPGRRTGREAARSLLVSQRLGPPIRHQRWSRSRRTPQPGVDRDMAERPGQSGDHPKRAPRLWRRSRHVPQRRH